MSVESDVNESVKTNLDDIINDVVSDVAQPSPVADMSVGAEIPVADSLPGVSAPTPIPGVSDGVVKRKAGRPKKSAGIGEASPPRPKLEGVKSTVSAPVDLNTAGIEPCAELCVMMVNSSGMMLGGESAAMQQHEISLAKNGFVSYFKAKGIENVPPWVILMGAVSPYYLRIVTTTPAKTTVSTIAGRAWFGMKEWIKRRKNARSYSRDNAKRQNDTGAEISTQGV